MSLGLFEPFLIPGAALHALALHGHQAWLRRETPHWLRQYQALAFRPPCIVVGGLRMKGSGKSTVTASLARHALAKGLRLAILTYARPAHLTAPLSNHLLTEVTLQSPWTQSSDEALMHQVVNPLSRVYATRHRTAAYLSLATLAGDSSHTRPDLVLCDDGLFDPRLDFAARLVLLRPDEKPSWHRLFPAGPQRGTWAQTRKTDLLVYESATESEGLVFNRVTIWPEREAHSAAEIKSDIKPDIKPGLALCAHAHGRELLASLAKAGLPVAQLLQVGNHRGFAPSVIRRFVQEHLGAPIYCGPRDAVKVIQDCGAALDVLVRSGLPARIPLGFGDGLTAELWVCRHEAQLSPSLLAWFEAYCQAQNPLP